MASRKKHEQNLNLPVATEAEWEAALVDHAKDATAYGGGGIDYISTKGGKFTFNGQLLKQPLEVVILDVVRENTFFEGSFDPDEPKPPTCFALARDEDALAPPADLASKQAERCGSCWANEFGTADRGKGKACKNTLRAAVLPANDLNPAVLAEVEPALLRISPTSLKHFSKYAKQVAGATGRALFGVVTALELIDDAKDFFHFEFKATQRLSHQQGAIVLKKRDAIEPDMLRPPQTRSADEKPERPEKPSRSTARERAKYDAAPAKPKGKRTPQKA